MIIYIYGTDTFRSRQYLKDQIKNFKTARDPQGYNVIFLDAKKAPEGKIISEITTTPFLATKRMVIIENILTTNDKELLSELIDRITTNKIPESNIIVFWQGEGKSKVKEAGELEKILQKEKYARDFIEMTPVQKQKWINGEIKNRGGKISGAASNFLTLHSGDMWQLNSLLDQLVAYAGEKEITTTQIQLFLEEKIDDNIFNMVEAIVSGNHRQAFKLLNEQRRLGEDDFKIFGLIVWQFRLLLSMRSLFESEDNITSDQMAKKLKIHPFVVRKNLALVKRYTLKKLKDCFEKLLQIDWQTKTGRGDQSLLIDLFISQN